MPNLSELIIEKIKSGLTFENPGGGSSIVQIVSGDRITYKRGNSIISISVADIDEAFQTLKGKKILYTNDLKQMKPHSFDSGCNGHSCNCTFVFLIFKYLELCDEILGKGKRGSPFYVKYNKNL